jgi:hypothetical protein
MVFFSRRYQSVLTYAIEIRVVVSLTVKLGSLTVGSFVNVVVCANSEQRTANSEQRTANSEQRTANSEQRTANSEQQTANSEQRTGRRKKMIRLILPLLLLLTLTTLNKVSSGSYSVEKKPNSLFAFVTYLYNESDILPYWLEYHTKLAGISNVAVIDNRSPNKTQLILQEWEKKGLKVIHNTEDYKLKGNTTYKIFKRFFSRVYFAVPLDADEFIVALDRSGEPLFSKAAVVNGFEEAANLSAVSCFNYLSMFKDCNYYGNETIENDRHFYKSPHPKKRFFKLSKLHGLDHGNHLEKVVGLAKTEKFFLFSHKRNPGFLSRRDLWRSSHTETVDRSPFTTFQK